MHNPSRAPSTMAASISGRRTDSAALGAGTTGSGAESASAGIFLKSSGTDSAMDIAKADRMTDAKPEFRVQSKSGEALTSAEQHWTRPRARTRRETFIPIWIRAEGLASYRFLRKEFARR